MKDIKPFKAYSPEYDAVMNTEHEVVQNVYAGSIFEEFTYSVKISNDISILKMIECYDGDQPSYERDGQFEALCENLGIHAMDYRSIADYPRHGNTLRFAFRTFEDARNFLDSVKSIFLDDGKRYEAQARAFYNAHPEATRGDF